MKTFFLFLLLAPLSTEAGYWDRYTKSVQQGLNRLSQLNEPRASGACKDIERNSGVSASCMDAYLKLYQKDKIDMRVALGMLDRRAYGGQPQGSDDRYIRTSLTSQLTKSCQGPNVFACGFAADPRDGDLYTKKVVDPLGREKIVRLRITHSSASAVEAENRGKMKDAQTAQSEVSRKNFLEGLEKADVVIYNGHAREGGGPDFNLPIRKKDGHPDYKGHYLKNRPGLNAMVEALRKRSDGGPAFLGLLACKSKAHFYDRVKPVSPASGQMTTGGNYGYFDDGPYVVLNMLDSLLGQRCEGDFQKSINGPALKTNAYRVHDFFR